MEKEKKLRTYLTEGTHQNPLRLDKKFPNGKTLGELLSCSLVNDDAIDTNLCLLEDLEVLKKILDEKLTCNQRQVITLKFGLGEKEPMNFDQIAYIMQQDASYVSRVHNRALYILRKSLSCSDYPIRKKDRLNDRENFKKKRRLFELNLTNFLLSENEAKIAQLITAMTTYLSDTQIKVLTDYYGLNGEKRKGTKDIGGLLFLHQVTVNRNIVDGLETLFKYLDDSFFAVSRK